jgi:membrane protein implicated in regulation of membrane protease activity
VNIVAWSLLLVFCGGPALLVGTCTVLPWGEDNQYWPIGVVGLACFAVIVVLYLAAFRSNRKQRRTDHNEDDVGQGGDQSQ